MESLRPPERLFVGPPLRRKGIDVLLGLPVAATGHGACLDYLDDECWCPIDADRVQFLSARVEHLETLGLPFRAVSSLAAVDGLLDGSAVLGPPESP